MVALSFASDAEANVFFKTVTATVANRSKKRRSRKFSPIKTDGGQDTGYDSGVVLRNPNSTGEMIFLSVLITMFALLIWRKYKNMVFNERLIGFSPLKL